MALNPNTPDPTDQKELNALIKEYIELSQKILGINEQQARQRADAAKQQGTLNKEIGKFNDELNDTLFKSDSLAKSFQESLAELKNQNSILQQSKTAFGSLTSIAQDLNYFQRGITELSEKDLKKKEENLSKSISQLTFAKQQLSTSTGEYNRQSQLNTLLDLKANSADGLTKNQQALLDNLQKEKNLLETIDDTLNNGIDSLNQELQISKQIQKTREDLGGIARAAGKSLSDFGGSLSKYLNIDGATEAVDKFNKKLIDDQLKSESVLKQIKDIENERIAALNNSLIIQGKINNLNQQIRQTEIEENNLAAELLAYDNKRLNLEQQIEEARTKGTLAEHTRLIQQLQQLDNSNERSNIENKINTNTQKSQNLSIQLGKKQKELSDDELKVKQKIAELDKKEAKVKEDAVKSVNTFSNKFKALGVFIGEAGKGLTKTFTDPVFLLNALVELGFKADKQVTELSKSFGLSKSITEDIRQDVAAFARSTGDTFINTDRLLKAQAELSQEMGMAVKFSNEELATFAKLTELTGLSAQEAGKLAKAATAAGMSTEKYTKGIREGAFAAMQATKTHFSMKEVMQDISKLSSGILVKFQGNPKALAQAVVEAKKLGTDLQTIDKIGDSLLNWETSINNELEAELMTGRQLNMERARAAALSGDQLALTREISSQVGTLKDYQNMNVLAQGSLAKAFGLSRDEMSEMLMKQEAVNKYGKEAATLNREQLEDMKRRNMSASEYLQHQEQERSAQDKFNDAMSKLKDIIGNLLAGPVGQLLDALANMVGFVMKIFGNPIVTGFFNIISWIAEKLSDIASTTGGSLILGLTAMLLLSNKIAFGFGSIGKSIMGIGKGITSMFSGGAGAGGFISNIQSSFKKGLTGAGSAAATTADTAALNANTAAMTANSNATRLNATQMRAYQSMRAAGIPASQAYNAAKVVETGATTANTGATTANTGATAVNSTTKGINNSVTNTGILATIRERAAKLASSIATGASTVALGAWNIVKGISNGLMNSSLVLWMKEKIQIAANTVAKWLNIGATAAQATTNTTLAATQTAVATTGTAAAGGLTAFLTAATAGAVGLLAFGAAILMVGAGISLAALGLAQLVKSFKGLTGGEILGALTSIAIVMGGFVAAIAALGSVATIVDIPLLALGAAFLMLGAGIGIAAYGMSFLVKSFVTLFKELAANWKILIPVGIGLAAVAVGVTALGAAAELSTFGLIILSGSMFLLGKGLQAISAGTKGITELFKSLSELDAKKLGAIAPALGIIGSAILKLGAGTLLSAIGGILGGKGPVGIIKEIAASGSKLQTAASALSIITSSITQLNAALAALDISKLEKIAKMNSGGGITGFVNSIFNKVTSFIGGGAKETTALSVPAEVPGAGATGKKAGVITSGGADLSPMVAAINEVRDAVNKLYSKDTNIYLDGDKVSKHVGKNPSIDIEQAKKGYSFA